MLRRSRAFLASAVCLVLAAPALVHAQETVVAGTARDATDAVLPGVTVTARHVESGNTFLGVTDVSGGYRIGGLRPGVYNITAELSGFSVVTQEAVELQVGQRAGIDFEMVLASVQETVTVTGAIPLLDLVESDLGGVIDRRQMEELPLNGRNWMALTMLAPGSRANAVSNNPFGVSSGWFQLNLDGQQVSTSLTLGGIGQPRFSRDAIAEFELISNRFDATQGRSKGIQINAVTKSGTNTFSGTVGGYFRHNALNAEDHVLGFTPKYQNQQVSMTFGGPIIEDRFHFFGFYEGEREPRTLSWNTPYPAFNIPDIFHTDTVQQAGLKIDAQLTDRTRLSVRTTGSIEDRRTGGSATQHPSVQQDVSRVSGQAFVTLTQTTGRSVNTLKGGLAIFHYDSVGLPGLEDVPFIIMPGLIAGKIFVFPLREYQDTYSIRDDFTMLRGNHEIKLGGEMLIPDNFLYWPNFRDSMILAFLGLPPNLADVFPVWNDWSTWDIDALSPHTFQVRQGIGNFKYNRLKPEYAAWFQDNWAASSNLTFNLGVRWDFYTDAYAKEVSLPPFKPGGVGQEWFNFGPRLGFAYSLPDEKTVLRGGWGIYYMGMTDHVSHVTYVSGVNTVAPELFNDGRADFASNPFGTGTVPSFLDARLLPHDYATSWVTSDEMRTPYTNQTSVGIQRQLGNEMVVSADYVWNNEQRVESFRNVNVSFDPVTGAPMPYSTRSTRPFPDLGLAVLRFTDSYTNYHGLETSFTKRFSDNWQLSGTYTLSGTWNYFPLPLNPGCQFPFNGVTGTCNTPLPVPVVQDYGDEYTLSAAGGQATIPDQRHRGVINGIWQLPGGFQLSGLYFFASGERREVTYNGNLRNSGSAPEIPNRLRPDGTIVPRNSFVGDQLHRVDMRVQKRFNVGGISIDAIAEVFNLFNRRNFGSWVTDEASAAFGGPQPSSLVEYQARQGQLGIRIAF